MFIATKYGNVENYLLYANYKKYILYYLRNINKLPINASIPMMENFVTRSFDQVATKPLNTII